jgi:hypothetical protein
VNPVVAELVYYPLKGCAGTTVDRAVLGETGLRHDRSLMLVGADGAFLSQRVLPAMAVIRPRLSEDGTRLSVSAAGAEDFGLTVRPAGPRREVSLFKKWFGPGVDQGDAAAEWFSAVLGRPARLVRVPPGHDRDGWGEHPGKVGFADAHAILVAGLSSLDNLNARILERGAQPVPMNRFRPNIVISGWPEPHTEDRVRRMSIGTVEFGYAVRCARCAVPMVEQTTGLRDGPEPTRTLADYRRDPEYGGRVSFGMKAAVLRSGTLAVGDPVLVSAWGPGRPETVSARS